METMFLEWTVVLPAESERFPDDGLRCVTWNTGGLVESLFLHKETECSNLTLSECSL